MRWSSPVLSVAALLVSIAPMAGAETPPAHTVTTSGEAIVYVTPDEVIVNLGVTTFDENLDKAKTSNDEQSAKLIKAIKALGVEDKNVQIDRLQVSIEYRTGRQWEGIRGYMTRRAYSVKLTDMKLFEKLVDAGLKNGANEIHGFEFRSTEMRKYRDQARSMAIKAAREKAIALAKDLDCTVGSPWQINEGPSYSYWGGFQNSFANAQNSVQVMPGNGDASETLPVGQIPVRANVSVVFDLIQK